MQFVPVLKRQDLLYQMAVAQIFCPDCFCKLKRHHSIQQLEAWPCLYSVITMAVCIDRAA